MAEPKTILVLDDWEAIRMLLASMLERQGYQAVTAGCIVEAAGLLDQQRVDFGIIDYELAEGTSRDLIPVLNEMGIPFAVHTGNTIDALEADIPGQFDIWPKPMEAKQLLELLAAALNDNHVPSSDT
jgi:DNA-binding NtrC family response regulator